MPWTFPTSRSSTRASIYSFSRGFRADPCTPQVRHHPGDESKPLFFFEEWVTMLFLDQGVVSHKCRYECIRDGAIFNVDQQPRRSEKCTSKHLLDFFRVYYGWVTPWIFIGSNGLTILRKRRALFEVAIRKIWNYADLIGRGPRNAALSGLVIEIGTHFLQFANDPLF